MPASPRQRVPLSRHLRGPTERGHPSYQKLSSGIFSRAPRSLSNARLVNLISCRSVMDGVIDVLVRHGYLVVFGWVLAEQIGLPLPAVPFLLAAGALAGDGRLSLALVLAAAALASRSEEHTSELQSPM